MPMGSDVLSMLGEALRTNISLQTLDLSCNNIPDRLGPQLVNIIKDQVEQRDTLKWRVSLRKREGERGEYDAAKERAEILKRPPDGLTEFSFHHNSLGRKFIELLAQEVATDPYVRKLDLSYNSITMEDALAGPFIEAMKLNESAINVNLVGNKGFTAAVKGKLALCLLKNLEIYKATG
mmetsp:Transcript_17377/g.21934  ORF Transcript_17377/g.21934 Transcript_17377/m.21934 type:complete len:179 (-) Transcript_17377:1091-1627(-)